MKRMFNETNNHLSPQLVELKRGPS